jgi:hypothetical protein
VVKNSPKKIQILGGFPQNGNIVTKYSILISIFHILMKLPTKINATLDALKSNFLLL